MSLTCLVIKKLFKHLAKVNSRIDQHALSHDASLHCVQDSGTAQHSSTLFHRINNIQYHAIVLSTVSMQSISASECLVDIMRYLLSQRKSQCSSGLDRYSSLPMCGMWSYTATQAITAIVITYIKVIVIF